MGSHPFSLLRGYGRPSLLVPPPSGLNFCEFFPFLLSTFSSLLVVFALLCIAFALCRKFFGVFWTQIAWSSGNWRFYANCRFFLAISVFLPLIASLLWIGVLWTLIYLFVFFVLLIGVFDMNCSFSY